jgi:hypothetical protein
VFCTQLTEKCHSKIGQLNKNIFSLSLDALINRLGISCAGNIIYDVERQCILFKKQHREAIQNKVKNPLCLK